MKPDPLYIFSPNTSTLRWFLLQYAFSETSLCEQLFPSRIDIRVSASFKSTATSLSSSKPWLSPIWSASQLKGSSSRTFSLRPRSCGCSFYLPFLYLLELPLLLVSQPLVTPIPYYR